jgi:hypothetical protein
MLRLVAYLQIILILAVASTIAAQRPPEIGIFGLKDWTKDEELKNPYGFGIYLFQPLSDKVKLTIEYDYLTSKMKYLYYLHYPFSGGSTLARVIRRNHVSSYQIGFRHLISQSGSTSLEFGGGLCLVYAGASMRVVGFDEHWSLPAIHKYGPFLDVGLLVSILNDLPLTMRFGFRHRFLVLGKSDLMPCGGGSISGDPITTTEVSWGLGYQFGR